MRSEGDWRLERFVRRVCRVHRENAGAACLWSGSEGGHPQTAGHVVSPRLHRAPRPPGPSPGHVGGLSGTARALGGLLGTHWASSPGVGAAPLVKAWRCRAAWPALPSPAWALGLCRQRVQRPTAAAWGLHAPPRRGAPSRQLRRPLICRAPISAPPAGPGRRWLGPRGPAGLPALAGAARAHHPTPLPDSAGGRQAEAAGVAAPI